MAASFTQSAAGATDAGASFTIIWGGNTTTNNWVFVAITTNTGAVNQVSSVTDSQSNSYLKLFSATPSGSSNDHEVWYTRRITGGTTPTITVNLVGSERASGIAFEVSGVGASGVLGYLTGFPTGQILATPTKSGGPGGLLIATIGCSSIFGVTTVDAAWAGYVQSNGSASFLSTGAAYKLPSDVGSQFSATFTTANLLSKPVTSLIWIDSPASTLVSVGDGMSRSEVAN